ncbi:MAG: Transcription initiation factor TFIID subunit 13 [Heterodermia speciosa]|uniref:Transcription initiation factor TFIID subunit 13 n=1 Tax=Heterodermia speciosa TaxID=116794 RepID=A0A8H3FBH3_9LECA|nr:MAG: Transcription initiation factor TFIID subunit 13 [Heterodermia speciosa]
MTEPRARAARHKGQLNFESEIRSYLYAFGDVKEPLDETVRVLDELATDFVIETCHKANQIANLSGRQKVKVDDFKFAIRGNEAMLGKVQELFSSERKIKDARKQIDFAEGKVGLERGPKKAKKGEEKGEDRMDVGE